jgi:hypothetical protein
VVRGTVVALLFNTYSYHNNIIMADGTGNAETLDEEGLLGMNKQQVPSEKNQFMKQSNEKDVACWMDLTQSGRPGFGMSIENRLSRSKAISMARAARLLGFLSLPPSFFVFLSLPLSLCNDPFTV